MTRHVALSLARQLVAALAFCGALSSTPGSPAQETATGPEAVGRTARLAELHAKILCDCYKEKWTRTLEGCFENCVNKQKGWIEQWIDAGRSNDEILRLMVERVRTDKVLLTPRGALVYVMILVVLAGGVLVVGVTLVGLRKPAADLEKEMPGESVDGDYDERLERQLRELDD